VKTEPQIVIMEPASPVYRALRKMLIRTGWVATGFAGVVVAILTVCYLLGGPPDPSEDPTWKQLHAKVLDQPQDKATVELFRQWDFELRRKWFWYRRFLATGAWLALLGGVIGVGCWIGASQLRDRLPLPLDPQALQEFEIREGQQRRIALLAGTAFFGLVLFCVAIVWSPPVRWQNLVASSSVGGQMESAWDIAGPTAGSLAQGKTGGTTATTLPPEESREAAEGSRSGKTGGDGQPAAVPAGFPQMARSPVLPRLRAEDLEKFWEMYSRNWPRFRGPEGSGIYRWASVPQAWDIPANQGVVWKTPIPFPGNSSPVIWEDRIFLTGALPDRLMVYCLDLRTGEFLWEREIPSLASPPLDPKKVAKETGFASPTPATNGRLVFVMFAPGDIAALDFAGNVVWNRNLGVPDNVYGHAASLECFPDRVFVQLDQGSRPEEGKSRLVILDAATGETLLEVPRPVPNSWASPIVVFWEGKWQLITAGAPWIISYDPITGNELWRFAGLEGDVGPSPVFCEGIVNAGNEYSYWFAIRADGQGDVSETHLLWKAEENLPDLCSPLATSEFSFLLASWGMLTCYDARTGDKLWELELEASFISSPGMAGDCIYVLGEAQEAGPEGELLQSGRCWVIRPSREKGEIVSENPLGEGCTASPAFHDGRLFIRTRKHLICIGEPFHK
jgi:outer membrane protein assembly factor BamB